jgi:queuine tRNA-ribosyltransferase
MVASTGARIVLATRTTCGLRPGAEVVRKLGGLHGFTRWPHAMLTTPAGSRRSRSARGTRRRIRCEARRGRLHVPSHLDGSLHRLTPRRRFGSRASSRDIQMQLDVCPPAMRIGPSSKGRGADDALGEARPRTERPEQQGSSESCKAMLLRSSHVARRRARSLEVAGRSFDGLASEGSPSAKRSPRCTKRSTRWRTSSTRRDRATDGRRHAARSHRVHRRSIDMFDCVYDAQARNGQALTRFGRVVIKQAQWKVERTDRSHCGAVLPGRLHRGYLRHLYLANEMTSPPPDAPQLVVYGELVAGARAAIRDGTWPVFKQRTLVSSSSGRWTAASRLELVSAYAKCGSSNGPRRRIAASSCPTRRNRRFASC